MKVKIGTGVLGKDGQPFAPDTMSAHFKNNWSIPLGNSESWLEFATAVGNSDVVEIIVIDKLNRRFTFTK